MFVRYPEARAIRRKIIFHAGPTNSGKTHHALDAFFAADSGVYCGPLRLLANEIYQKSNKLVTAIFRFVVVEELQQDSMDWFRMIKPLMCKLVWVDKETHVWLV